MSERLRILELIEAGEINVEEGARRLEALTGGAEAPDTPVARPAWVRHLWQAVSWTGIGLMTGGGVLVTTVQAEAVAAKWLTWGWLLLACGVLGLALGWWLQRARWFFLRVRQPDGPNVFLAFPIPLGLVAWALRILRPFVPQLEETGADELILALREEPWDDRPLVVEVNEGEGGEQVQIYFG